MIDNRLKDSNGDNSYSYHRRHFSRFTGFPDYHNTNIDKVCQFLDEPTFNSFLEFGEQDKAYDIDYAHGLELDDEFGDPFGIDRNGLDDVQYRFILKCHILAIKCNGTLPELVQFVSAVLGCSQEDVTLGMARHYVNDQLVGEPDTILIKNINIKNVNNDQLIPLLANQLQLAVAADKRVLDVNFYTNIPYNTYVGVGWSSACGVYIKFPKGIFDSYHMNINAPKTAALISMQSHTYLDVPRTVVHKQTINLNNNTGITTNGYASGSISIPDALIQKQRIDTRNGVRIDSNYHASMIIPIRHQQSNHIQINISRNGHFGISAYASAKVII